MLNFDALLAGIKTYREHLLNYTSFIFFRILNIGLFAVTVSLYITEVGKPEYGRIAYFLIFYNFLTVLDLGFGYALNYRMARSIARLRPERATIDLIRRGLPFYFVASVGGLLLIYVPADRFSELLFNTAQFGSLVRIMGLSVMVFMFDAVFVGVLRAFNKIYLENLSKFIFDVGRSLALLGGILTEGREDVVLWAILASSLVKLAFDVAACVYFLKSWEFLRPRWHWREIVLNLKFGFPMLITTLVGLLIANLDKIFIGKFIGETQYAYYSVAFDINSKVWLFVYALNNSLYTVLIRRGSTRASTGNLILISFGSVLALALFYYLPVSFFAYDILKFWIAPEFAEQSAGLVPPLACASVLYLLMAVLHNIYMTQRRTAYLTLANLVSLGVLGGVLYFYADSISLFQVALAYCAMYIVLIAILAFGLRFNKRTAGARRAL